PHVPADNLSSSPVPEVPFDRAIASSDILKIRCQIMQSLENPPRFPAMNLFFARTRGKGAACGCAPRVSIGGDAKRSAALSLSCSLAFAFALASSAKARRRVRRAFAESTLLGSPMHPHRSRRTRLASLRRQLCHVRITSAQRRPRNM
ncbi:hypothetical protein, partial [Burkholderia sp. MSMB1498]|uniref:hypothetical protein n=1 Tax=Burkholderia sp. MSMB1498 TaxID=1637842 RepID=UPI001E4E24A6